MMQSQQNIGHLLARIPLLAAIIFITSTYSHAQTIYGKVTDKSTEMPLPGVNIIVSDLNPVLGTVTDDNGQFRIDQVPVGLHTVTASLLGYQPLTRENIRVVSGQDFYLEIALDEAIEELEGVLISGTKPKDEPINSRALIGARSFTLEETNKYAGSYGDPARMAMNYAGVLPVRDNRNDIIIRGNSAAGLQWRMDGIEIPNPNHFGASGTTGGPITIINTNMLNNSDFFNGAFPAEYGNAIAGVFDLRARPGNTLQRQHWAQLGWNGLEFGTEGPFKHGSNASYIASYRYSFMNILKGLGANINQPADYQDVSFKINFPDTRTGSWSLVGMGGKSEIDIRESTMEDDERPFETYGEDINNKTAMGMAGITHQVHMGYNSGLTTTASITYNSVENKVDSFPAATKAPVLWAVEDTRETKYAVTTEFNHKFSAKTNLSSGLRYDHFSLDLHDKQLSNGSFYLYTDTSNAGLNLGRAYLDIKHHLSSSWEAYLGLHAQYLLENDSKAIEPRFSIKYSFRKGSSLSYGFGLHSQMQPKMNYFTRTTLASGQVAFTNYDLSFTRSLHNIVSFQHLIDENHRIKIDMYHQYLFDVPIRAPQPAYSLINFGTDYYIERKDSLVNDGTGTNYGIEVTAERFVYKNLYYLFTFSLFDSKYNSTDGIARNTAYNGRFAINALAGYEFNFPKKGTSLVLGINLTYAGGSPYVPFDQQKTVESGRVTYDWDRAYQVNREDYKRASFRIGIKRNKKKFSMGTAFDFQYRSSYTSIYLEKIDVTTGEIVNTNVMGFYPMANFRINF